MITTDLNTTIGQVRLLLGDFVEDRGVLPDGSNLSDTQLQYFLDSAGDVPILAVADACGMLSTVYANIPDTRLGPRSQSYGIVSKNYQLRRDAILKEHGAPGRVLAVPLVRTDGYSEEAEETSY